MTFKEACVSSLHRAWSWIKIGGEKIFSVLITIGITLIVIFGIAKLLGLTFGSGKESMEKHKYTDGESETEYIPSEEMNALDTDATDCIGTHRRLRGKSAGKGSAT